MKNKEELRKSKYIYLGKVSKNIFFIYNSVNQNLVYGDLGLDKLINDLKSVEEIDIIKNKIKNIYGSDLSDNVFGLLLKNGFLIKNDNLNLEKLGAIKKNENKNYKLLRILLTDICNLNCEYCKVMKNISPSNIMVSSGKRIDDVLKIFFDGSEADGEKTVHITGGEPLIYWNKVVYIIEQTNKLKRKGEKIMFVVGTNGLLLDRDKIDYFKKNNIKIIVSLDGMGKVNLLRKTHDEKNSFRLVDKSILMLRDNRMDFGISMVIGKHNLKGLSRTIGDIISKYKPISLGVNFMKPPTKIQKDFPYLITPLEYVDSIYKAYKKHRNSGVYFELVHRRLVSFVEQSFRYYDCGAADGSTINLNAQGKIGPCKSFLVLGMVSEDNSINNLYSNRSIFKKRSPVYLKECHLCPVIAMCGNGCAYNSWVKNNNYNSIDIEACEYTKLFFYEFVKDLYNNIQVNINCSRVYSPTANDRKKLYGNIKIDKLNLNSSIGHET